jgi:transmembrane sensor
MSDLERDLSRIRAQLRSWKPADVERALREFQHRRQAGERLDRCISQIQSRMYRWSSNEVEAGLKEFQFRRRETSRRTRRSFAVGAVAVAAAAAVIVTWSVRQRTHGHALAITDHPVAVGAPAESSIPVPEVMALADGSEVALLDLESHADISEARPDRISIALTKGRAHFRVQHKPERTFVVEVGGVRIEDLGTSFLVERGPAEVVVTVSEGALRVSWDNGTVDLSAGERGTYPILSQRSEPEKPAAQAPSTAQSATASRGTGGEAWRAAAREGRYGPAFNLLQQDGFETVRDEPNDLLLAADVARLSGHPRDAVKPLRSLLMRYRRDPRSAAAAFTLGSVLLRDLGRPREAAQAFSEAERLAPGGNLAEDAVARAAEAWYRAGNLESARAELAHYAAAYPQGRYLSSLRAMIEPR